MFYSAFAADVAEEGCGGEEEAQPRPDRNHHQHLPTVLTDPVDLVNLILCHTGAPSSLRQVS